MNRRSFLWRSVAGSMAAGMSGGETCFLKGSDVGLQETMIRQFLSRRLYQRQEVRDWLEGKAFPFAKYDSHLGWLNPSARFKDGQGSSITRYTYVQPDGERVTHNYADRPCRINTYGDSFTQCHQVSDDETWQEFLAGHLQEPVRNFGIGGWSVYQAYLRMLKEEQRTPSEVIIFNIFDDDHFRNLDSWRNLRRRKHDLFIEPPLPHVRVNASTGAFEERPNPCPTQESLYDLCDLEKAYELFRDDFVVQILMAHENSKSENPFRVYQDVLALASTHGIETSIETGAHLSKTAHDLHRRSALFASRKIVEKILDYVEREGKQVLFVLSYPPATIATSVREDTRWDESFVEFLHERNVPVVDLLEAHLADFAKYRLDVKAYLEEYYVGHYNPRGNQFCAFAIKDRLVEMLDPKPLAYRVEDFGS